MREKVANWNISCQEWLRKCIYERVPFKEKSNAALATFMVSAFWHGTYTGYYLSFFFWFGQAHLTTMVYKESKREKSPWNKLYKALGPAGYPIIWAITIFLLNNNGIYFQILEGKACWRILNTLYWVPPIFVFLAIFLMTVIRGKNPKKPDLPAKVPPTPPTSIEIDREKER